MKRLVEVNREGGYPLTGEALEILAKDIPGYINVLLEEFTPDESIVFLSDNYAYFKSLHPSGGSPVCEIMQVMFPTGANAITKEDILSGADFGAQVSHGSGYGDTVNGVTYNYTREDVVLSVHASISSAHPKAYTLDSLLRERYVEKQQEYFSYIVAGHSAGLDLYMAGSALITTYPSGRKFADIDLVFKYMSGGYGPNHITVDLPGDFLNAVPIFAECYCNNSGTKPDAVMDGATIRIQAPANASEAENVVIHLVMHYQIISGYTNWQTFNGQ